jgi:hypothetical protein
VRIVVLDVRCSNVRNRPVFALLTEVQGETRTQDLIEPADLAL